jgi:ubiquitin C-terminal hydrolase
MMKKKVTTYISLPETLSLRKNDMSLVGFVVHHGNANGGHYTAFFVCDSVWYSYDDIRSTAQTKKVGEYATIDPSVYRNVTLAYYTRKESE